MDDKTNTEIEYALRQLAMILRSPYQPNVVADCAQRATDALERVATMYGPVPLKMGTKYKGQAIIDIVDTDLGDTDAPYQYQLDDGSLVWISQKELANGN